jgi:predicted transcriptional regulator
LQSRFGKLEVQQIIEMLMEMKADRKADEAKSEIDREHLLTRLESKIVVNQRKAKIKKEWK